MRNVSAGIVLISLAVYYFFVFLIVCFLSACFWRNRDADRPNPSARAFATILNRGNELGYRNVPQPERPAETTEGSSR